MILHERWSDSWRSTLSEGALLEAKNTAKKEFNVAIAAKERMITSRDAKLAQALRDVTELE